MATRQPKAPKTPQTPKPAKTPPPTIEAVAARLAALCPVGEPPKLWKEAELKRQLPAKERPLSAAALARLGEERQVLVLPQGKTAGYLFAGPLREWLAGGGGAEVPVAPPPPEDVPAVYARLVRQSGGFPDVKIAALRAALDPAAVGALAERLIALWREGRATFSQGDWSLADDASRNAAVELSGERYLLVRLDE